MSDPDWDESSRLLEAVRQAVPDAGAVWLVGGAVRDLLLRRRVKDFDFAVDGDGLAVARRVADRLGAPYYALDAERGVGRVILPGGAPQTMLDFAALRGAGLPEDLASRDFTINAMAHSLAEPETLIDPLGGQADLRARRLRVCGPRSLSDDPLRGLRAVRLAGDLGLLIEPATRAAVREHAPALARTSAERRRDEFIRCLAGPRPAACLRALDALGLLPHLAPELAAMQGVTQSAPHVYDVWDHTLMVLTRLREVLAVLAPLHDVDAASDLTLGLVSVRLGRHREALHAHLTETLAGDRPAAWLLATAAAFHDVGKPRTRSVEPGGRVRFFNHDQVGAEMAFERMGALRLSVQEQQRVRTIVAQHMRPLQLAQIADPVSRRAIYRFFRDAGAAGVQVVVLSLADFLGTYGDGPPPTDAWNRHLDVCVALLRAYFEEPEQSVRPPPLLNGNDLIAELGLEGGPEMGRMLEALREAQAAGDISSREAALEFVRRRVTKPG